ncbi:MAG TPA: hypothetical protein PKA53_00095 [Sphingobacterium sp.]|nr:hypothetical protein [Sphingobacterium sp.]
MKLLFRHITAFLIAVTVLVQAFDRGVIWSGFYMNQSYIIDKLCENKDKPERHCEGNCHLHKALEKSTEKEAQQPKGNGQVEWLICEQPIQILPEQFETQLILTHHYPKNDRSHDSLFYHKLIKPPTISA